MMRALRTSPAAVALAAIALAAGCSVVSPGVPEPSPATSPSVAVAAPLEAASNRFALDAPLPNDPAVAIGRLENGFTYYVRANARPENRASLRLLVNAGSILEDDDQRGLAHFVEHMAFNGTENFEKQELVDYLERIGMRFGADLNAYTSFDETAYMLEVPTDDPEIFATAFQILEDWAHRLSFEPDEIDRERGVMVEEWRLGRGARARILDQQLPALFFGSRYAERLPIGKKEVLENAPPSALTAFYSDWYRPDLMAVVAVGDFEPAGVVERVAEHFGRLPSAAEPRPRPEYPIPDHTEPQIAIASDDEATSIALTVGFKRPLRRSRTVGDARVDLVDSLYHGMMNSRLAELTRLPDPPFLYGYAGSGPLGRTKAMYRLTAGVSEGGVGRGLTTLLAEAKRVAEHGFLDSELERAKTNTMRDIDRLWKERDKQESSLYVRAYSSNYFEAAPIPDVSFVRDLYQALVVGIELAEINARARQWITDGNRVILLSGPPDEAAGLPDEREVLELLDAAEGLAVAPWTDRTRDEPLIEAAPEPGRVISEETLPEVGALRWKLSNGIELVLKPTDFKNDEVLLRGYSPGGHSLVPDEDYVSATQASAVVGSMGLGNFDSIELGKALTGKVAGVNAYVAELSEGISGYASPTDLETLFQLLHLRFTGARRDEAEFRSYLAGVRGRLENQEASPGYWFEKRWNEVTFRGHPRRRLLTLESLAELDLDRALEIYRDRFSDASDFVFTMVGSFEPERVRPLVETWLASLPAERRGETFRDVEAYAAPGVSRFEVRKGLEPRSSVRLVFHGFAPWSPLQEHIASSLAEALRIRLREVLREDLGGVYGVRVSSTLRRYPKGRYNSGVSFACDPERTDELVAALFAELDSFQAEGPPLEIVEKVREIQRRARETALEQNPFWLAALHVQLINELPLGDILAYDDKVDAVTRGALRDAARRYFDAESYILGVLEPEGAAAPAVPDETTLRDEGAPATQRRGLPAGS